MEQDQEKTYVVYDFETCCEKDLNMNDWEEEDGNWSGISYKQKEKPFSYESMLTGVMDHLDTIGGVEFAVLKDPELGRWWSKKVKKREEKQKLDAAREKLRATMTKEELKILGITTIAK